MTQNHQVRFGVFEADFRAGELRRSGVRVHVQEQPFRVLQMLFEHRGEIVTREEIQQALWPGNQAGDFDHGINVAVKKLRDVLDDNAEGSVFIETLARRGYRLIAPIEDIPSAATAVATTSANPSVPETESRRRARGLVAVIAISLVAVSAAGYYLLQYRGRSAAPEIRSLAVLPLVNLSGDPSQEYFVDGITDELITNLGNIKSLKVISRTSVMRFKNSTAPLPEIARQLKVDAVLEGSVVRRGDRVRITAQLIHAASDTHMWAESFDRQLPDVYTLCSEVTRAIAEQVQAKVTPQEQHELEQNRPVVKEAYDAYLQGRYLFERRQYEQAAGYFEIAVQKDPQYLAA